MPDSLVTYPEPETFKLAHIGISERARRCEVIDLPSHAHAETLLSEIAGAQRAVADAFKEPKAAAHKAHRFICEIETALLKPLDEARRTVADKALRYEAAEREKAAAQERALQEAARKGEEEARLAAAIEAEALGQKAVADVILDQPPTAIAPVVKPAFAENRNATQTRWHAEVTDLLQLVRYVAGHADMLYLLEPSMPALNKMATAQKELLLLPGVKVVKEEIKIVRR